MKKVSGIISKADIENWVLFFTVKVFYGQRLFLSNRVTTFALIGLS